MKSEITINGNVSVKIKKKHHARKKSHIWNPSTCTFENGKYLGSVVGDSVITCDKI